MKNSLTDILIDSNRIHNRISNKTRHKMSQLLDFSDSEKNGESTLVSMQGLRNSCISVQNIRPNASANLLALAERMTEDLLKNSSRLLSLNPSRRLAIANHLELLAFCLPGGASVGRERSLHGNLNKTNNKTCSLKLFLENLTANSLQASALRLYFEELSTLALGQILLLKHWSDEGLRPWKESDIGHLNWCLNTFLKPSIPLDREGWQIVRPNLYSWYNPDLILQAEIWQSLQSWSTKQEGPHFFMNILTPLCPSSKGHNQTNENGYDTRFYSAIWAEMEKIPFQRSLGLGRKKTAYSPTLRDGSLLRSAPLDWIWVGLESSPLQLMLAELLELWSGPKPPPLWALGSGLEVHNRDQLAFNLSTPKPSVLSRISEMQACDLAFVFEEIVLRSQTKTLTGLRLKEQLEHFPYFKKIRSSGTSLGDLQGCVAISKLRPGGLLWWARDEALQAKDGAEMLNFLLARSTLLAEWDFSEVENTLPAAKPLFPKHLYLFRREVDLEARLSHRPTRHSVQGILRSHVELSLLLKDALSSLSGETNERTQAKGQWSVVSWPSPTSQKDWMDKWPDPTSQGLIRELERLRSNSSPLVQFTMIRPTPEGDLSEDGAWSVAENLFGFWLKQEQSPEGSSLSVHNLPTEDSKAYGSGYLILFKNEDWVRPLQAYMTSELVQKWLDCYTERKAGKWVLGVQVIKWVPVPKLLMTNLGVACQPDVEPGKTRALSPPPSLPEPWPGLLEKLAYQPKALQDKLEHLLQRTELPEHSFSGSQMGMHTSTRLALDVSAQIFIQTSHLIEHLMNSQSQLFPLVSLDGKISWKALMRIIPPSDCVSIAIHPSLRMLGHLPPQLAVDRIERVKHPTSGILLSTESGMNLHLGTKDNLLLTILWEQLEKLKHPTWAEILEDIRLPRKVELAESTALDILGAFQQQKEQLQGFQDLLNACQLF